MSDFTFAVEGGHSVRLKTAGKYCPRDIVVTAKGSADSFYDQFWDAYQENGNRMGYFQAFSGRGWTDETFKPKYKIKPTGDASGVFYLNQATKPLTAQMVDFSGATSFYNTFRGAQFKEIELIDFSGSNQVFSYTFDSAATEKIGLLILSDIATARVNTTTFNKMPNLSYIRIQGTLGQSFSFSWSPLDRASMESVIASMSDTATDQTATFKKTAVNAAFTTDEWNALVASKPNWTIILA